MLTKCVRYKLNYNLVPLLHYRAMKKKITFIFLLMVSQCVFSQCIEGDCFNGYGKFSCDCGYVFEGDFVNGKRVTGTLTKSDLVYTGEFLFDLAHGFGKIVYQDSSWYEGTFQENVPTGYGTYFLTSTQKYIGEIENSEFRGLGTLLFTELNGQFTQIEMGQFKNDLLDGVGFKKGVSGDYYLGFYDQGQKHGFGVKYSSKLQTIEAGEYKKKGFSLTEVKTGQKEKSDFFITEYKMKKNQYSFQANKEGSFIKMERQFMGVLDLIIIFTDDMLYLSSKENLLTGKVINEKGELFDAVLNSIDFEQIVLTQQLYGR